MVAGSSIVVLASELFGAVKEIASLIPNFSERRKREMEEEIEKLADIEKAYNDAEVSFNEDSRSDELLGLADALKAQDDKIKNLIILYAKELRN